MSRSSANANDANFDEGAGAAPRLDGLVESVGEGRRLLQNGLKVASPKKMAIEPDDNFLNGRDEDGESFIIRSPGQHALKRMEELREQHY